MLEAELELVLFVILEPRVDLRENAPPCFLLIRENSEHRLESLAIEFALNEKVKTNLNLLRL